MNRNTKTLLAALFFAAHLALLLKLIVFKFRTPHHVPSGMVLKVTYRDYGYNIVPFKTIVEYLSGYPGWIVAMGNLLGNIIPFMPLGFLLPLLYRPVSRRAVLVVAVAISLCMEVLQLILRTGTFDVDDILLNSFGVMLGYLAFLRLTKWMPSGCMRV